jgi:hypothetical protein
MGVWRGFARRKKALRKVKVRLQAVRALGGKWESGRCVAKVPVWLELRNFQRLTPAILSHGWCRIAVLPQSVLECASESAYHKSPAHLPLLDFYTLEHAPH